MDEVIEQIVALLKSGETLDDRSLDRILRDANRRTGDPDRHISKKRLLPFYLRESHDASDRWRRWNIDGETHDTLVRLLRSKPRRTASGVATITVLTKPWPCASDCLYCPNDLRMPKSYLSDEPACQRAERCYLDPYLQVASRLRVLEDMGHNTDKVELIVLGGTWSEYPRSYQRWFVREMFRCVNDLSLEEGVLGGVSLEESIAERRSWYESIPGLTMDPLNDSMMGELQDRVNEGALSYNRAYPRTRWGEADDSLAEKQHADMAEVEWEQRRNESSGHRVVGLAFETRPDLINEEELTHLRRLGCTKVQMGIQSLDPHVLAANTRLGSREDIDRAFALLRLFGFKSHIHLMLNLLGSDPEKDRASWLTLIEDERYKPDEVKLYPCALVESANLTDAFEEGVWQPYSEGELLDVLGDVVVSAPPFLRISRMIRDISSKDIIAGNRKTNLRQLVEERVAADHPREMRLREIATREVTADELALEEIPYSTSNTEEVFMQWVTPDGGLAAFLRLSLPHDEDRDAMIREVHVYGRVARLHETKEGAQHLGLGHRLVERACVLAREDGRKGIKVISAVGTREYYRNLGFEDDDLYLRRSLEV